MDRVCMGRTALPRRPRACIFDLDGTLIDSEPNYFASDRSFLARYGIDFTEEFSHSVMGRGSADIMRLFKELYPDNPFTAFPVEEMMAMRDNYYIEYAICRTRSFPVMARLVETLDGAGLPLGLASGSSPAVIAASLEATGLGRHFPVVVSAGEVTRGKPDPGIFFETAKRMGMAPETCLVFEDSLNGLLAAKAAGMRCVVLPAPGSDLAAFASADLVIEGGPGAAVLDDLLGLALGAAIT
jgi:HAD superfamily hydrolase (TIGR01509 family)